MLFFIRAHLGQQPPMPREQWLGMTASTWQVIKQLENGDYLDWEVIPMIPADRALDGAKWALQQLSLAQTR